MQRNYFESKAQISPLTKAQAFDVTLINPEHDEEIVVN